MSQKTKAYPKGRYSSKFAMLRDQYGLRDRSAAAEYFGVTERTITKWDKDGAPAVAMKLLELRTRNLGAYHPDWNGFSIGTNGKLFGPGRIQLSAEHLRRTPEVFEELEYWKREAARLRALAESRVELIRVALSSAAPGLFEALRAIQACNLSSEFTADLQTMVPANLEELPDLEEIPGSIADPA